jgi:hypothetical protein
MGNVVRRGCSAAKTPMLRTLSAGGLINRMFLLKKE